MRAALVLAIVLGAGSVAAAATFRDQAPAAGAARPFKAPAPKHEQQRNGLTHVHLERDRLPIVSIVVVIRTGVEPAGKSGVAKVLAQMLPGAVESPGFGATVVSSATRGAIYLRLDILEKHFAAGMKLLAETTRRPQLDARAFEAAKSSRLLALGRVTSTPDAAAALVARRALWPNQPEAHSSEGRERDVRSLTLDDLGAFHRERFEPGRAGVIVVGSVGRKEVTSAVERYFGDWPSSTSGQASDVPPPGEPVAGTFVAETPDARQAAVVVAHRAPPETSPDYAPALLLHQVLGGDFASRLNMNLREDKGWTYGARTSIAAGDDWGVFSIHTAVDPKHVTGTLQEITKELERVRTELVPARETDAARERVLAALPGQFETVSGTAGRLAELVARGLPHDHHRRLPAQLEAITPMSIRRAATAVLSGEGLVTVVAGDRSLAEAVKAGTSTTPQIVDALWEPPGVAAPTPAVTESPAAPQPPADRPRPRVRVAPLLGRDELAKAGIEKIAIPNISGTGVDADAVEVLSGVAVDAASLASRFSIVGASDIEAMIGFENQKELLGCDDMACYAEIGGSLGVDAILSIRVGRLGGTYRATASLIDIRHSRPLVRASAKTTGPVEELLALVEAVVSEVLRALP